MDTKEVDPALVQLTPEQMHLREALISDLNQAKAASKATATSLGVDEPSDFAPRALRQAGRAVGESELKASKRMIEQAVKDLAATSKLTDQVKMGQFKTGIRRKLRQAELQILKKTSEMKLELARRGYDQATRHAIMGAFSGLVGNSMAGIIGGTGGQSNFSDMGSDAPSLGVDLDFGYSGNEFSDYAED